MKSKAGTVARAVLRPEQMFPADTSDVHARFVATRSGLRVRIAEAGDAAAEAILMLHGWGNSLYAYRHLFEPLAMLGRRPIAFDLKGHGLSDKPVSAAEYTLDSLADHALEVADALGLEVFDVAGHSMGGRIATEIALRAPHRVRRLLLINPAGFGPMPHVRYALPFAHEMIARLLPSPLPSRWVELPIAAVYGSRGSYTERDIEEYRAPTQFREFLLASVSLLRRFDWRVLDPGVANRVRDRAWIVAGELDRVVCTVRSGEVRRLEADDWRVKVVPGVAHVVHEETPEEVVDVAADMIRSGVA